MRRSNPKEGFAWGALARTAAEQAGYQDAPYLLEGTAFTREGGVSPFVQVFFQRVTNTETAPVAFLGVHVTDFEREWRDRLRRTAESEVGEFPPFALHAMNVWGLMERPWSPNSPAEEDIAAVQDWLDRVFDYAKRLPPSVPALVAAIEANKIADHNVEAYLGHPVKVRGLVEWLHRNHGVDLRSRVLPLLSDRTEPYDLNIMLGPPPR
jgi:hypothetical protein